MTSALFTELTLSEQASLAGGQNTGGRGGNGGNGGDGGIGLNVGVLNGAQVVPIAALGGSNVGGGQQSAANGGAGGAGGAGGSAG